MTTAHRITSILATCFALIIMTGCGNSHHSVTGTVKLKDGDVIKNGKVVMTSDKSESFAEIQPDGTYTMGTLATNDGVPPGTYRISVEAYAEPSGADDYSSTSIILPKYSNPDTSGLTLTVDGNKVHDIVVEKAK